MNSLPPWVTQGTFGELLVQIRLFQHSVQASPPIKDSGNDLIAVRGECFRAIQVKTTGCDSVTTKKSRLPALYHILALVILPAPIRMIKARHFDINLDHCGIFLLEKDDVDHDRWNNANLHEFALSAERIDQLFR